MNNSDEVSKIDTSGFNSAYSAWSGYQGTKSQSSIDRVKGWAEIIASICAMCA